MSDKEQHVLFEDIKKFEAEGWQIVAVDANLSHCGYGMAVPIVYDSEYNPGVMMKKVEG